MSFLTLAIDGGPRFDRTIPGGQGATVRPHVNLNRLLERVPDYVDLALRRLKEADTWYVSPQTERLHLSCDLSI